MAKDKNLITECFKAKKCKLCGKDFFPKTPAMAVHPECRKNHYRKLRKDYMRKWRVQIKSEGRSFL